MTLLSSIPLSPPGVSGAPVWLTAFSHYWPRSPANSKARHQTWASREAQPPRGEILRSAHLGLLRKPEGHRTESAPGWRSGVFTLRSLSCSLSRRCEQNKRPSSQMRACTCPFLVSPSLETPSPPPSLQHTQTCPPPSRPPHRPHACVCTRTETSSPQPEPGFL